MRPQRKLVPLVIILAQFVEQKKISTYQIFNNLKNTEYKRAYANVLLRVKELVEQKLIKKTDEIVSPHAATYYMLTPLGIEFLLFDKSWLSLWTEYTHSSELIRLIKNYGDYLFFEIFAYPFFKRKTLEQMKNYYVIHEIFEYFENCVGYIRSTHPPIDLEAWERSISEEQLNLLKKHIAENASGYLEKLIFVLIGYSDLKEHSEPKGITLPLNFDEFLVDDLKLLARDRKFVRSAAQARKRLDTSYKKFKTYGKAKEQTR